MNNSAPLAWPTVASRLREQHGQICRDPLPLGNKREPYDELVYVLLTVMTNSQPRIDRAFDALKRLAGPEGWSGVLDAERSHLRAAIEPLGFVNKRTKQLTEIVERIDFEHHGSLGFLGGLNTGEALDYLTSLPGVGEKTAKCVLMYSLGRDVLPVDIHVLRVAKRLGLVAREESWKGANTHLESDVPDHLKYEIHVGLVIHGREICKGPNPRCNECIFEPDCPSSHSAPRLRSAYTGP